MTRTPVSQALWRLLAGLLLVSAGWLASPHAVPIYDGISTPDEPYRYVQVPPGVHGGRPPEAAFTTTDVTAGASASGVNLATSESGPQAGLLLQAGALATTARRITVGLTPMAAPRDPAKRPGGLLVDGNVYAITLDTGGPPVTLTDKAALATLLLRATSAQQPPPSMWRRTDPQNPWVRLKTSRAALDVYVVGFPGAGEYALAYDLAPRPASAVRGRLLLGIAAVAVLVALVVGIRVQGRRQRLES